jgi:hypothetical protein
MLLSLLMLTADEDLEPTVSTLSKPGVEGSSPGGTFSP